MEKETAYPKKEISEIINAPNISVPKKAEVLNAVNNGNNGFIRGNKGDPFEDQLKEIDRELNCFDSSENNTRGAAANNNQVHVKIVDLNSSIKVSAKIKHGKEVGASHVDDLNFMPFDQKVAAKTDSQEGKAGSEGNEGQLKQKTWTCVTRGVQNGGNQTKVDELSLSKHSFIEVVSGDVPNKRRLVAHNSQETYSMVEAAGQPCQEQ